MFVLSSVIQLKYARHNAVENESKEKFCTGKNKSEVITSTGNIILCCLIPETWTVTSVLPEYI